MKINEFINESGVGKIVKGVNTTQDVQPGEAKRQAAKFGFKLGLDGTPPELHKAARKNSTPHTLYNLGLAESTDSINEDMGALPSLTELIIMAVVAKTSVAVLKQALIAAYKTGKGLITLKKIADRAGVALDAKINPDMYYDDEEVMEASKEDNFIKAALGALDKLVAKSGKKQSIGGYAFDISRVFKLPITPRELEKKYYEVYGT